VSSPGLGNVTSTAFDVSPVPLAVPTFTSVTPSLSTAGVIVVNYNGSWNAPITGQTYNLTMCSDLAMTANCQTKVNFTSGTVSGLNQAMGYYAQLEAMPSTGYLSATSPPFGPTIATSQLTAPTGVTLDYGTTAGSLAVTFSASSNAPAGQIYSATACTDSAMRNNCVTNASIASGGQISGIPFPQGSVGTPYYVSVSANASTSYVGSSPSSVAGPQNETSALNPPQSVTGTNNSSGSTHQLMVTFKAPSPTAPSSYSAQACTDLAMTNNCSAKVTTFTLGSTITGYITVPSSGTYYVTVTALRPGYIASSAQSASVPVQ
jgi:hypothetical protein